MTQPASPAPLKAAAAGFCDSFAAWAASGQAMPDAARAQATLSLLDTWGCILAGWDESQTRAARAAFGPAPGPFQLALVLGAAAHALDLDDYETPGSTHPSAPILAALLALSRGRPIPLDLILDAYATGFEAIIRLGEVMRYDHYAAGWHATATLGGIGAAAASARALGLDRAGTAHALAIAASLAGGLKAQFGSDAKALHAGFAARAGLEAAHLAQAGATAVLSVFEGAQGFVRLHHGAPADPTPVLARIGRPPGLVDGAVLRKPWPCCAYSHRPIEAALALHRRDPAAARGARAIALRMPEPFFRVAAFLRPQTPAEARFSAAYCVVAALLDGAIGPQSFDPAAIRRTEVRRMLDRLTIDAYVPVLTRERSTLEDMSPDHPDTVSIVTAAGQHLSESVAHVRGGPALPLSQADLVEKFVACGGSRRLAARLVSAPLAADGATVGLRLTQAGPRLRFGRAVSVYKDAG